jgi:chemotaxis protein CheD
VEQPIAVGLGELAITADPSAVIVAFGLGSCVGIVAYDPVNRVGGMLHAMLPSAAGRNANGDRGRTKFVDTGFEEMLARLTAAGARRERLIWRLAGGAQMLTAPGLTDRFNIGRQNVAAALDILARERFRLAGADSGGHEGRTVRLYMSDGRVTVRKVSGEERPL